MSSFTPLSRENNYVKTYDKNFMWTILHVRGKIAVLWDGLTQIHFGIHIQMFIHTLKTLSTSTINPTLIKLTGPTISPL